MRIDGVYARVIKRMLDIICALLAIIVFSWLYLIIAVLVALNIGTPIIFKQKRPGRIDPETGKEKIFTLYKFRSMSNARDDEGNLLPDSVRLTKFGRILRATSLDELPEAWNILIGDMSVVGPRPWAVSYIPYFTKEERKRHLVRPGLSGWAQVNGRTAANWDERLKYDIDYVNNISFLMDVIVIFLTVKKVLKHSDQVEAGQQVDFSTYIQKQWDDGVVQRNDEENA